MCGNPKMWILKCGTLALPPGGTLKVPQKILLSVLVAYEDQFVVIYVLQGSLISKSQFLSFQLMY